MPKPFQRIGLIGKHGDPAVRETIRQLFAYLKEGGKNVLLDDESCHLLDDIPHPNANQTELTCTSDLIIVVGGDGTMLRAARALAKQNIPLLGINLGRLGFLADISPAAFRPKLDQILAGQYEEEARFLLRVDLSDKTLDNSNRALNDIVLHKVNIARMIEFETYINEQLVNDQRADGLIVSTPTGSTAYALSGGGPLIHPSLNALVMVPICPHTLSNRPIVVEGDSEIEIHLARDSAKNVQLTCDGQTSLQVEEGQVIRIRKDPHQIRLIHPVGHDYYSLLRAKLGWGRYTYNN